MEKDVVVSMIGLGYIGLPTAALIASKGITVHGVDVNEKIVNTIKEGRIHIIEPDLEGLVAYAVKHGFLQASTSNGESDVYLVAVPTPFRGDVKGIKVPEPDISYVEKAVISITPNLEEGNIVIIESTCPVGTTEKMAELIFKERKELVGKIYIAYCPERVLPGQVIYELEHNDRSIGGINEDSTHKAKEFYSLFVKGKLHGTDSKTAEMCKLVENAYRDVNIAFANELSIICDSAGIDVRELINLTNKHPRVNILQPGPGVGGHCIAVDPWFIVSDYPEQAKIIKQAREINNYKEEWVIEKIQNQCDFFKKENNCDPVVACMGLAYKPDIDDIRESPALSITKKIIANGTRVLPVEPNVDYLEQLDLIAYDTAIEEADIVVFLVAHSEFKNVKINDKIMLDFCGVSKK